MLARSVLLVMRTIFRIILCGNERHPGLQLVEKLATSLSAFSWFLAMGIWGLYRQHSDDNCKLHAWVVPYNLLGSCVVLPVSKYCRTLTCADQQIKQKTKSPDIFQLNIRYLMIQGV